MIRDKIQKTVLAHEWALQMHGFYLDKEDKEIRFDVVMAFEIGNKNGLQILHDELDPMYPDYTLYIQADIDITD